VLAHVYQTARYHFQQGSKQKLKSLPQESKTYRPAFMSVNKHITCYCQSINTLPFTDSQYTLLVTVSQ